MQINERARVVLIVPRVEDGLVAGDFGTVDHVYDDGKAYEVEFVALDGHTTAVVTVEAGQLRAVMPRDMTHSREIQVVYCERSA